MHDNAKYDRWVKQDYYHYSFKFNGFYDALKKLEMQSGPFSFIHLKNRLFYTRKNVLENAHLQETI